MKFTFDQINLPRHCHSTARSNFHEEKNSTAFLVIDLDTFTKHKAWIEFLSKFMKSVLNKEEI